VNTVTENDALGLAKFRGVPCYVNRYEYREQDRMQSVLLIDAYKSRLCCAIAYPDGTLERVVQGYSHSLEMAQKEKQ
jgi:hypothetical protein